MKDWNLQSGCEDVRGRVAVCLTKYCGYFVALDQYDRKNYSQNNDNHHHKENRSDKTLTKTPIVNVNY